MVARSKLNSIESKLSETLSEINHNYQQIQEISHEDFMTIINE